MELKEYLGPNTHGKISKNRCSNYKLNEKEFNIPMLVEYLDNMDKIRGTSEGYIPN